MNNSLSLFVKEMRKRFGLTQVDLAAKAGVGLRFVRELEQGTRCLPSSGMKWEQCLQERSIAYEKGKNIPE